MHDISKLKINILLKKVDTNV